MAVGSSGFLVQAQSPSDRPSGKKKRREREESGVELLLAYRESGVNDPQGHRPPPPSPQLLFLGPIPSVPMKSWES